MNISATLPDRFSTNVLPERFMSYKIAERLDYTGQELYDYLNGGAEVYISYGLVRMTGCKYSAENLPQVSVEIYEMATAADAFGIYTQSRDKEEFDYGQGSQSFPDFILFWKNNFFVIVNTPKVTMESAEAIISLATLVDKSILKKGNIPSIISNLPKENLIPAGYVYFHHYIWLNSYYFIANYNILNINDQTNAVLAKYNDGDGRLFLLIVEYPDAADAKTAYFQLVEKYVPELSTERPVVELEDKTWFACRLKDNKIMAVFNGASKQSVEQIMNN